MRPSFEHKSMPGGSSKTDDATFDVIDVDIVGTDAVCSANA